MILWILLGLAILILFIDRKEHMSNDDLLSTLKTFGESSPKKKKNPAETNKAPILGPRAPVVVPADSGKTNLDPTASGVYPDIYGPEIIASPGTKSKPNSSSKHESDNVDDKTYEFNPDLQKAFPTEGPPQPFLTDFSKIH
jgi:hypothetical protein